MIFEVVYPGGERACAVGYPGQPVRVNQIPPGPESCHGDVLEVDFTTTPCRVLRVVGGPRRPTLRVRVPGGAAVRDRWMDARDAEGWSTLDGHDPDPDVVWLVGEDGLDPAALERDGATLVAPAPLAAAPVTAARRPR